MSQATKCDCCGRTSPEVSIDYQLKKRFTWFVWDYGYDSTSLREIDVCTDCWKEIGKRSKESV